MRAEKGAALSLLSNELEIEVDRQEGMLRPPLARWMRKERGDPDHLSKQVSGAPGGGGSTVPLPAGKLRRQRGSRGRDGVGLECDERKKGVTLSTHLSAVKKSEKLSVAV